VEIGVVLSDTGKQQFIESILSKAGGLRRMVKLYLLERQNETEAIKAFDGAVAASEATKKWYVEINKKKVPYPPAVD
jgi:hypothetical protein